MKKTKATTAVLAGIFAVGLAGNAWAEGAHFGELTIGTEGDTQTYTTVVTPTAGVTDNGPTQAFNPAGPINAAYAPGDEGWSPRWETPDGTIFVCPLIGKPSESM
ncbi:MAG: hypothetical protein OER56_06480 [Hyphomicrobiales bacterium]|nr:hypothetical protein [Hyphomicrobiales bacterium]